MQLDRLEASSVRRGVFAVRMDIDSVVCLETGVPNLLRLGDRLGMRFTFFVNMGRSFSWRHTTAAWFLRKRKRRVPTPRGQRSTPYQLPTSQKLGRSGLLRTALLNPPLGRRYRAALDQLHSEGHELGLHGGFDHAAWQYSLDALGDDGLDQTFRRAFDEFRSRYGRPRGFASPGFRYNSAVLDLLDREGFDYASDMGGETPFRPSASGIATSIVTVASQQGGGRFDSAAPRALSSPCQRDRRETGACN